MPSETIKQQYPDHKFIEDIKSKIEHATHKADEAKRRADKATREAKEAEVRYNNASRSL